ncbi:MAG: hypothetical protein K6F25_08180 [Bacteroidales bacterium]|nr:hypothetical protein [Bacteroidales bacterium]
MEEFFLPLFICVVLPVMIVWIISRTRQNEANKRAEIMLKAIEAGMPVDADLLKPRKKAPESIKQNLLGKLNGACVTSLMGVAFLALGIIRSVKPEFDTGMTFDSWLFPAGGILLAVGIGLFITYFAGKKMLAKEIEAEEKKLEQ